MIMMLNMLRYVEAEVSYFIGANDSVIVLSNLSLLEAQEGVPSKLILCREAILL